MKKLLSILLLCLCFFATAQNSSTIQQLLDEEVTIGELILDEHSPNELINEINANIVLLNDSISFCNEFLSIINENPIDTYYEIISQFDSSYFENTEYFDSLINRYNLNLISIEELEIANSEYMDCQILAFCEGPIYQCCGYPPQSPQYLFNSNENLLSEFGQSLQTLTENIVNLLSDKVDYLSSELAYLISTDFTQFEPFPFEPFPCDMELCMFIDCSDHIGANVIESNGSYSCADSTHILFYSECCCTSALCFPPVSGCVNPISLNFNPEANVDDGSCEFDIISQLYQSFDAWNISIDLSAGWNMFGYGCPTSIDVAEGLSNHTESIIITKDNNGNVYMPEFGFNGIGDFTPGFGYQIKLTEAIEGFSLCDWYVNDIPEDNIVSLQEEVESLQAELDSIYGCIDENACNYDSLALVDDESCEYAELGYDCEGNITEYVVGMEAEGGIVFYVDETGERGLVAALEDLIDDAVTANVGSSEFIYGPGYRWGCNQQEVFGADGISIGTGFQNTIDILNQGCALPNGDVSAAKAAADAQINGYSDWYLPSADELLEMFISIENVGGFYSGSYGGYWSSSEHYHYESWFVSIDAFNGGVNYSYMPASKINIYRVRPIRAFGNWTMGCMDSLACNYNPDANMADGSCTYPEQGYDCDGNIVSEYQVGDLAEGGIVFYIDETGQHGLVAALEDLTNGATDPYEWGVSGYEWGCYGFEVPGANRIEVGTGLDNTLDIIAQECQTQEGGVSAAHAIFNVEINGYTDWYLPSINELNEMYFSIGNGSSAGNIGGFDEILFYYWSSSQIDNEWVWLYYFSNGDYNPHMKYGTYNIRPIRSF